jgi:hypothetical protein
VWWFLLRRLAVIFGGDCPEISRAIRHDVREPEARGRMGLMVDVEEEGTQGGAAPAGLQLNDGAAR